MYYKKLSKKLELLKKPINCQFLLAKITKRLKGKKDAIKILSEIKVTDPNEKIFEIKANLKIAKYKTSFYADCDVGDTYKKILSDFG